MLNVATKTTGNAHYGQEMVYDIIFTCHQSCPVLCLHFRWMEHLICKYVKNAYMPVYRFKGLSLHAIKYSPKRLTKIALRQT